MPGTTCRTALVAIAFLFAVPASAQMNKCVAADGTVSYQARPCSSSNGTTLAANREVFDRAVADREYAQRRDRCRNAKDIAERQRALLASDAAGDRKAASDEIAIQERRMRQDSCAAL